MKPHCTHCRERFSEYLDGLLPAPERDEVDAHLAACAECAAELERWRATLRAVGTLPRQAAPEGFRARVMARLPREARPAPAPPARPRLLVLWARALPVAAMLLLVFGVVVVVQRSGTMAPLRHPVALARRPGPAAPPALERRSGAGGGLGGAMPLAASAPAAEQQRRSVFALRPNAAHEADQAGLAFAKGVSAGALKDGAMMQEKAMPMQGVARPAGGDLVFRQTRALPHAAARPEQVLTLYSADPAGLIRRAVEVANRQGLEVTLVFKPGGRADISVQIPPAHYKPLVAALSSLTAPESQSLSNSALARGEFFRRALDNYNARNRLRQKRKGVRQEMAAAPAGAAAGMRQSEATLQSRAALPAAPAPAVRAEKPSAPRAATEAPPSVVNLQITIQRPPAPEPATP